MGDILIHPTAEQTELMTTFKTMRQQMPKEDAEIDAEGAHLYDVMREEEAYWRRQNERLWWALVVVALIAAFELGWIIGPWWRSFA